MIPKKPWLLYIAKISLLALVYTFCGGFGFSHALSLGDILLIWPPAGIGLAALLIYGINLWPGIFIGSILANWTPDVPVSLVLFTSLGNTLAAISSTYALHTVFHFERAMQSIRDVILFILVGTIGNALVSATIGAASMVNVIIPSSDFFYGWWTWGICDAMGIILFTPLVLAWFSTPRSKWHLNQILEGCIMLVLLAAVSQAVYGGWLSPGLTAPLSFALLPFVSWAALRLGRPGATTITLIGSGFAIWGSVNGRGPFIVADNPTNFLYLHGFMMTTALTALLMTAVVSERGKMQADLARSENRYQEMLNNVPTGIARTDASGKIFECNHAIVKMLGFPDKESVLAINSNSLYQVLGDREQILTRMKNGGIMINNEVKIRRYDGSSIWVNLNARAIESEGEVFFEVAAVDVSRRKEAEEMLEHQWDENTRLLATLEKNVAERTRQLSTLYKITELAAHTHPIDYFLGCVLETVLETFQCNDGAIILQDQESNTPRLAAARGKLRDTTRLSDEILSKRSPWLNILENDRVVLLNDFRVDTTISKEFKGLGQYGFLGAPIRISGKAIGGMGVICDESGIQYSPEDISLLEAICDQIGSAIESAWLRAQAEQSVIMEERQRLARELHDSVTQSIYSITLMADAARRLGGNDLPERTEYYLDELSKTSHQALKEMRLMIYELRPSILEQQGLEEALRQRIETVEKHTGIDGTVTYRQPLPLPPEIEEGLLRIAQESLNNVTKHSEATSVSLFVTGEDGFVTLEIIDNGIGFDPQITDRITGIGLSSIRERTKKMGGTLEISSNPGKGTKVKVMIKVTDE